MDAVQPAGDPKAWVQLLPEYVGVKTVRAGLIVDILGREQIVVVGGPDIEVKLSPSGNDEADAFWVTLPAEVFARHTAVLGVDWLIAYPPDNYLSVSPGDKFTAYMPKAEYEDGIEQLIGEAAIKLLDARRRAMATLNGFNGQSFEWPARLKAVTDLLAKARGDIFVGAEISPAGDVSWIATVVEAASDLVKRRECEVRFGGDDAAEALADWLEHKFPEVFKPEQDQSTAAPAGAPLFVSVVTFMGANKEPLEVGTEAPPLSRALTFRTMVQPGAKIPHGAVVGELKMTMAWKQGDPSLDWQESLLGQHFLCSMTPMTMAQLQQVYGSQLGAEQQQQG